MEVTVAPGDGRPQNSNEAIRKPRPLITTDEPPIRGMGEIVRLNVGGRLFTTTKATLCADPHSMLTRMLHSHLCVFDDTGCMFIDRDGTYFHHVLHYLRMGQIPELMCLSLSVRSRLRDEADFYQLHSLVEALNESLVAFDCRKMVEKHKSWLIRDVSPMNKSGRTRSTSREGFTSVLHSYTKSVLDDPSALQLHIDTQWHANAFPMWLHTNWASLSKAQLHSLIRHEIANWCIGVLTRRASHGVSLCKISVVNASRVTLHRWPWKGDTIDLCEQDAQTLHRITDQFKQISGLSSGILSRFLATFFDEGILVLNDAQYKRFNKSILLSRLKKMGFDSRCRPLDEHQTDRSPSPLPENSSRSVSTSALQFTINLDTSGQQCQHCTAGVTHVQQRV